MWSAALSPQTGPGMRPRYTDLPMSLVAGPWFCEGSDGSGFPLRARCTGQVSFFRSDEIEVGEKVAIFSAAAGTLPHAVRRLRQPADRQLPRAFLARSDSAMVSPSEHNWLAPSFHLLWLGALRSRSVGR